MYRFNKNKPNQIFVFGSNLAGRHGAGAALDAVSNWGAKYGQAFGRQGRSFAIPTKGKDFETLTIDVIECYVNAFIDYADENSHLEFLVTRIGCGLAGYQDSEIAPLFKSVPYNCVMPPEWNDYVDNR